MIDIINLEEKIQALFGNKKGKAILPPKDGTGYRRYFDELLENELIAPFENRFTKGVYMLTKKARFIKPSDTIQYRINQKCKGLL